MKKIVVEKSGSSITTNEDGIDRSYVEFRASDIARHRDEYDTVVVSSGSVMAGRAQWLALRNEELPDRDRNGNLLDVNQQYALIGSGIIVAAYANALYEHQMTAGQILATHHDMADKKQKKRLKNAILGSLGIGVVPVINENDVLSDNELRKLAYGGDNDGLARVSAELVSAGALIIRSEGVGLLDPDGSLVSRVGTLDISREQALGFAGWTSDSPNSGGTKAFQLIKAAEAGIEAFWAGPYDSTEAVLAGEAGTFFEPTGQ